MTNLSSNSSAYDDAKHRVRAEPRTWVVTGVAGFIGCNILEALLRLEQHVVGLDNFATGHQRNLDSVRGAVTPDQWRRFRFIEGDIIDLQSCRDVVHKASIVLHHAALGSVPRSVDDPLRTHHANADGFLNMLVASRDAGVERFIYAASSSTYGDHPALPKVESQIGRPLSPYAVTKLMNEVYADVFARTYGQVSIGLRYFNVFGPRQDPNGPYAAVVARWIAAMRAGEQVCINGDGESSRDFCYVANAVQANILAATADAPALNQVYNVAVGRTTTLNELYALIRDEWQRRIPGLEVPPPDYGSFRPGDVRHSLADIAKAHTLLKYEPTHTLQQGLVETIDWYLTRGGT